MNRQIDYKNLISLDTSPLIKDTLTSQPLCMLGQEIHFVSLSLCLKIFWVDAWYLQPYHPYPEYIWAPPWLKLCNSHLATPGTDFDFFC